MKFVQGRAAAEEALWHFPAARSSVQVRNLLERRDFVVQHPDIASRLLTRAAQSSTAGLEDVLVRLDTRVHAQHEAVLR